MQVLWYVHCVRESRGNLYVDICAFLKNGPKEKRQRTIQLQNNTNIYEIILQTEICVLPYSQKDPLKSIIKHFPPLLAQSVKVFGNSGFSCKLVFGLLFMAHFQTLPFMMLKVNQIIIPFCAFTKKYSSIEKTLSLTKLAWVILISRQTNVNRNWDPFLNHAAKRINSNFGTFFKPLCQQI